MEEKETFVAETEFHLSDISPPQHAALVGGPNAVNCPQCQKLFMNGEQLMEHMKYTHRDPNASGVAGW